MAGTDSGTTRIPVLDVMRVPTQNVPRYYAVRTPYVDITDFFPPRVTGEPHVLHMARGIYDLWEWYQMYHPGVQEKMRLLQREEAEMRQAEVEINLLEKELPKMEKRVKDAKKDAKSGGKSDLADKLELKCVEFEGRLSNAQAAFEGHKSESELQFDLAYHSIFETALRNSSDLQTLKADGIIRGCTSMEEALGVRAVREPELPKKEGEKFLTPSNPHKLSIIRTQQWLAEVNRKARAQSGEGREIQIGDDLGR